MHMSVLVRVMFTFIIDLHCLRLSQNTPVKTFVFEMFNYRFIMMLGGNNNNNDRAGSLKACVVCIIYNLILGTAYHIEELLSFD